jgi:hypothetical protein
MKRRDMASGYVINHQNEARLQARLEAREAMLITDGESTWVNPHFLHKWYIYRAVQLCFWGGLLYLSGINIDSIFNATWSVRAETAIAGTMALLYVVGTLVLWSIPAYKESFTRRCFRAYNASQRGGWFESFEC